MGFGLHLVVLQRGLREGSLRVERGLVEGSLRFTSPNPLSTLNKTPLCSESAHTGYLPKSKNSARSDLMGLLMIPMSQNGDCVVSKSW